MNTLFTKARNHPNILAFSSLLVNVGIITWLSLPSDVPVFLHDWAWPLTKAQGYQQLLESSHIWHDEAFGYAVNAPNAWFASSLVGAVVSIIGAYPALIVFLLLLNILAAYGTSAMLRELSCNFVGCFIGASVYMLSPVFYNKLHAGHIYYLIGYALTPLACYLILRAKKNRFNLITCGVLVAIAASQFQFIFIDAIALIFFAVERFGGHGFRYVFLTLIIALGIHIPDYYIMATALQDISIYPNLAIPFFQRALSVPLVDAISQIGYIGGYEEHALGFAAKTLSLLITVSLGVISLSLLAPSSKQKRRLTVLGMSAITVGSLLVSGYDGPLFLFESYLFERFAVLTAFREFYNFAILVSLGTTVLLAVSLSVPKGRLIRIGPVAIVVASFGTALLMGPIQSSRDIDNRLRASISSIPGRAVYLPGSPSMSVGQLAYSGVDPFQTSSGQAESVTYSQDSAKAAYWYGPGIESLTDVAPRFNWTSFVFRGEVQDKYLNFLDPTSRRTLKSYVATLRPSATYSEAIAGQPRALRQVLDTNRVRFAVPTWPNVSSLPGNAHILSLPPAGLPSEMLLNVRENPLNGFAQSARWLPAFTELSCLPMSSIFRILTVDQTRNACTWKYQRLNNRYCLVEATPVIDAFGPCSNEVNTPNEFRRAAELIRRGKLKTFFITQSYNANWRLNCGLKSYAPNVLVDSYASGWILAECRRPYVHFVGDEKFRDLILVSTTVLLIIGLAVFLLDRRMQNESYLMATDRT